jgi:hypothetical protein
MTPKSRSSAQEQDSAAAAKHPLSLYRYTHAKNDPAHCTVPGLFQPLKRGTREGRNHTVTHQYGDVSLVFRCYEPLGADDLRVLQGLLAIGSPISDPVVLTAESPDEQHQEIRKNLQLSDSCHNLETLVVQGSCYQLAKEIGISTEGSANFRRIRKSIERLYGVSIIARYKDGRHHGYQLIAGYASDEKRKEIHVVLNPRLTAAVLGKRIDASGAHTRVEMDEVRRIKGDATRILHQYLCAIISPGETKELLSSTLRTHIWHQVPDPTRNKTAHTKWLERVKKQHQRIGLAMAELSRLGWHCTRIADNRPNRAQKHYIKWQITRPAILEAEKNGESSEISLRPSEDISDEPRFSTELPRLEKNQSEILPDPAELVRTSPAKALREFGQQLTDEQFSIAAGKQPIAAIKHCLDRMSDEQFSSAATRAPEAAMRYALHRLSAEQFDSAAGKAPTAAIRFALTRLTPAQFVIAAQTTEWPVGNPVVSDSQLDAWFSCDPQTAVQHLVAILGKKLETIPALIPHLSHGRLAACAQAWPAAALRAAKSIPVELLSQIARSNPDLAIQFAGHAVHPETMEECILAAPAAAITHRFGSLDAPQRKWCLKKSPWTAAAIHYRDLTAEEREACRAAIEKALPGKLDLIIRECPSAALQFARQFLTNQQIKYCEDAVRNSQSK